MHVVETFPAKMPRLICCGVRKIPFIGIGARQSDGVPSFGTFLHPQPCRCMSERSVAERLPFSCNGITCSSSGA